jgi:gluconolactonase
MSELEVLDPRFGKLVIRHAKLERLWTGARWVEGPAYDGLELLSTRAPGRRIFLHSRLQSGVGPSHWMILSVRRCAHA